MSETGQLRWQAQELARLYHECRKECNELTDENDALKKEIAGLTTGKTLDECARHALGENYAERLAKLEGQVAFLDRWRSKDMGEMGDGE